MTTRVKFTADVYGVETGDGQESFHAGRRAEVPDEVARELVERKLAKLIEEENDG